MDGPASSSETTPLTNDAPAKSSGGAIRVVMYTVVALFGVTAAVATFAPDLLGGFLNSIAPSEASTEGLEPKRTDGGSGTK